MLTRRSQVTFMRSSRVSLVLAAATAAVLLTSVGAAAAGVPATASPRAAVSAGSWGQARVFPGLAHLAPAGIYAVSCVSAGSCTAGGSLTGLGQQAFVISQQHGSWGQPEQVPGLAALNTGGQASVGPISCASPGNCSAGGIYDTAACQTCASPQQAFVVSEVSGHWGQAIEVPGLAALDAAGVAELAALSCGSPGNCAAGGSYGDAKGHVQAFLATQKNGHWDKAAEVRGASALNVGGDAEVTAISCPSAGDCAAGGYYTGARNSPELFLSSEHGGTWGKAIAMPGIVRRSQGGNPQVFSLSCSSAGNCSAGGYYENTAQRDFAFVITESGGHWGTVTEVPGISGVSPDGGSWLSQLSCPSAGHCVGVGHGSAVASGGQAFYVIRT
jgi:hypothetical protein